MPEQKDSDVRRYCSLHTTTATADRAMRAALTPAHNLPGFSNEPSRLVKREGQPLPSTLESPVS